MKEKPICFEIAYSFSVAGFRWIMRSGNGRELARSATGYASEKIARDFVATMIQGMRGARKILIYRQAGSRRLPVERDEIDT